VKTEAFAASFDDNTRGESKHNVLCWPTQHVAFAIAARRDGRQNTLIFVEKHQFSDHYHFRDKTRNFASR